MRHFRTYLIGTFFVFASVVRAQTFSATVDRNTVGLSDRFQVQFTLSGGRLQSVSNMKLPDLNTDFAVLMGPSTSQSIQMINGNVTTSMSWLYLLQPRRQGTFTIGSASITAEGSTLSTAPIKIKVIAGSAPQGGTQKREGESPDISRLDLDAKFFLRAVPSKTSVYVGEPVRVEYKIYSRIPFGVQSMIRKPGTTGFWVEELEKKQERAQFEEINGIRYQVFPVSSLVFYPTKSGRSTIDALEAECTIQVMQRRKTGDSRLDQFFDDPFFDVPRNIQVARRSNAVTLDVKPLPESGRPASFSGAVGQYMMRTYLSKTKLTTSEACTLKVALEGKGNIKFLEEPQLRLSSGLEKYPPTIVESIDRSGATITGVKVFEYYLISRYPGSREVEPVEFSFFNPETRKYEVLRSPSWTLVFAPGAGGTPDRPTGPATHRDLRPLPSSPAPLARQEDRGTTFITLLLILALPLVLAAVAIPVKRSRDRLLADRPALERRRAQKTAHQHLRVAERHLRHHERDRFSRELDQAVWGYLRHKLTIGAAECSATKVEGELRARAVPDETLSQCMEFLAQLDYLRYAPASDRDARAEDLLKNATEVLIRLEQEVRP